MKIVQTVLAASGCALVLSISGCKKDAANEEGTRHPESTMPEAQPPSDTTPPPERTPPELTNPPPDNSSSR